MTSSPGAGVSSGQQRERERVESGGVTVRGTRCRRVDRVMLQGLLARGRVREACPNASLSAQPAREGRTLSRWLWRKKEGKGGRGKGGREKSGRGKGGREKCGREKSVRRAMGDVRRAMGDVRSAMGDGRRERTCLWAGRGARCTTAWGVRARRRLSHASPSHAPSSHASPSHASPSPALYSPASPPPAFPHRITGSVVSMARTWGPGWSISHNEASSWRATAGGNAVVSGASWLRTWRHWANVCERGPA